MILPLLLVLSQCFYALPDTAKGTLVLHIGPISRPGGVIKVAVYNNAETFMKIEKRFNGAKAPVDKQANIDIEIPDLPYGEYAIALFQDLNDNDIFDRNFLGAPAEPFGFSNNPSSRWRPASYQDSRFELQSVRLEMSIRVTEWP